MLQRMWMGVNTSYGGLVMECEHINLDYAVRGFLTAISGTPSPTDPVSDALTDQDRGLPA